MSRFVLALALALPGLFAVTSPSAAQAPVRPLVVPVAPLARPLPLPLADLKITSMAEVGTFARIIVRNQGTRAAGAEVVRMQVFLRGRLLGTFQAVAPPIPAGYSRAVTIRTNIRLNQPGL